MTPNKSKEQNYLFGIGYGTNDIGTNHTTGLVHNQ